MRCHCIKNDGEQCMRDASTKTGQHALYCWQHQKCKKNFFTTKKTLSSQKKPVSSPKKIIVSVKKSALPPKIHPKLKVIITKKPISPPKEIIVPMKVQPKIKVITPKKHSSRNLTVLSGPSIFTFFPNINEKRILLLGESHNVKEICEENYCEGKKANCKVYEVHEWLGDLAKNAPECLDFFLEIPYVLPYGQTGGVKPLKDFNSGVSAIRDEFNQCWSYVTEKKETCYSDHLRFHYIDLRGHYEFTQKLSLVYFPFAYIYLKVGPTVFNGAVISLDREHKTVSDERKKIIFSYLLGIGRNQKARTTFNYYVSNLAEVSGMTHPLPWEDFNKHMTLYYKKIDKELSKMNPNIDKDKFLKILFDIYIEKSIAEPSIIVTVPMDVYFLSRLFIIFDDKKLNRGPLGCRDLKYMEIKNTIVYGGGSHIKIYVEFLRRYFEVAPKISINQPYTNKCIKLDPPFDFFK